MLAFRSPQTIQPRNGRRTVARACRAILSSSSETGCSARWLALGAACLITFATHVEVAIAAPRKQPPIMESVSRCSMETLDIFADTRAQFSQEASSGAMTEALVDVRGCDFSGLDLRKKVMSGVILEEADFSRANLSGVQMSRADARGAKLVETNFTDVNGYGTLFDGADLRGANFENSMLSNASFGKFQGKWAELGGAHFEGALLSSSDIGRICENPTLDEDTRKYELGCRGAR